MSLNFITIAFRPGGHLNNVIYLPLFYNEKTEAYRKGSAMFKVTMPSFSSFHVFILFPLHLSYI